MIQHCFYSLTLGLALTLLSISSDAACSPKGSKFDSRIQYVNYNPGDIVVIKALAKTGLRIVFNSNETIVDSAAAFAQGWEITARKNILYIKPKAAKIHDDKIMLPQEKAWDTNLMVTTDLRMYDFDLQFIDIPNGQQTSKNKVGAYRVEFLYPEAEIQTKQTKIDQQALQLKINKSPKARNWSYSMQVGKNSSGIAPTMACDDGRFTYLKFPNNRDFPTVFLVADDKTESIVNTHVENDVLVIHRVSPAMVLRLGCAVVGIYNDQFDKEGRGPNEGTTVPDVKRTIKAAH